ncbi:DUF3078 domain-containing protein [Flavobacterium sp.]|uniref:DUF3078 domain-containing protein n=1 Tax=Flavobacterium sp. TaxID=239 RepID=UPI003527DFA1
MNCKFPFLILVLFFSLTIYSQNIVTKFPDTVSYWKKSNRVGFDISQIAFLNWNAGGNNSISGLLKGKFLREYSRKNINWKNELIAKYGLNKQEGQELRKTDDQLQINSTFGYRADTVSNWFYSSKMTFSTQFYSGYNYPDIDNAISRFMAPAYYFWGIGAQYERKDINFNMYLSPLTQKTTFVLSQELANQGAFGVDGAVYDANTGNLLKRGKKSRTELGILISAQWEKEVYKNMTLENRVNFYTDYLNNFGNIDVDWQLQLEMTVNEYVKANLGTHIVYDDDIKAKEEIDGKQVTVGPKIQLKQLLGVGMSYTF